MSGEIVIADPWNNPKSFIDDPLFKDDEEAGMAQPVKEVKPAWTDPMLVDRLIDRGKYTPDFAKLRKYKFIPVFINHPQLLQKGSANDILLRSESQYLGKAYSATDGYELYELGLGQPRDTIAVPSDGGKAANKNNQNGLYGSYLWGEVYALTPRAVLNVDRFLKNTENIFRRQAQFFMTEQDSPFKDGARPSLKCAVYLGNENWLMRNEYFTTYRGVKASKRPIQKDFRYNKYMWVN